jgi:carbonic anhydrase
MVNEVLWRSSILKEMIQKDEVALVGGMYSLETGEVKFFDPIKA